MEDVTKIDKVLNDEAQEYLFNVESKFVHKLPVALREEWNREVKQHFINGMKRMLENPNGGALLYVNRKSYDLGYRDGYADAIDKNITT